MIGHDFNTLASRTIITQRVWAEADAQSARGYKWPTLLSEGALVQQAAAVLRRLEQIEKERAR